jgi:hypothetical protein
MKKITTALGIVTLAGLMFLAPPGEWASAQTEADWCHVYPGDCTPGAAPYEFCKQFLPHSPRIFARCVVMFARGGELPTPG